MEINALYDEIRDQAFRLHRAIGNVANSRPYVEQTKNILYNRLNEIEEALKFAAEAEKQIKVLTVEIESADDELKRKDDEIAGMRALLEKTPSSAKKKKNVEQDLQ